MNLISAATEILSRIVARKQEELSAAAVPLRELRIAATGKAAERRDFAAALRSKRPAIISEIKKASPSKGVLVQDFKPADLARSYARGGAVALSVLTDQDFFLGSLNDLGEARDACGLPVLRKDFTISEYHVMEAAAAGADAILLIAAILDEHQLRGYRQLAAEFRMAALVEAHDRAELELTLRSGAEIVGVNNRDLKTFRVSLDTSLGLAQWIPAEVIKVSESGIFSASDTRLLMEAGFDAFLVGEHLLKSGDAAQAVRELVA